MRAGRGPLGGACPPWCYCGERGEDPGLLMTRVSRAAGKELGQGGGRLEGGGALERRPGPCFVLPSTRQSLPSPGVSGSCNTGCGKPGLHGNVDVKDPLPGLPPPPAGLAQSQRGSAAAGTEGALELPPALRPALGTRSRQVRPRPASPHLLAPRPPIPASSSP